MKLPEGGRVNCFFSVFWSHTCDVIVFPHQSVPHDAEHPSGHCRQKHTRCVPLRIFLIGDMIQIPSEIWVLLIHRQDISRPIKGPLEESLMYFVPLVWRVKSHRCQCTCQLFYCKIYTWFQNQTIKIWNLGTQTLGQACCILHDWSFHTWLVQAFWVVFFFFLMLLHCHVISQKREKLHQGQSWHIPLWTNGSEGYSGESLIFRLVLITVSGFFLN